MLHKATWKAYAALGLYALFCGATWFFEGRIQTFLRPDAVADRLIYVAVANLLIGIAGAGFVIRLAVSGGVDARLTGFGAHRPSALWVAVALAFGLAFYFFQGAPSGNPVVIINGFAQVFAVSAAEVLVCWALVGGVFDDLLRKTGFLRDKFGGSKLASAAAAAVISSLLFGLYHFGHSPPFNTLGMVAFLSVIGLATSVLFFVSRDVYATIVFHNFLAVYGVLQALAGAGKLESFETLQVPLVGTALVSLAILAAVDRLVIRRAPKQM